MSKETLLRLKQAIMDAGYHGGLNLFGTEQRNLPKIVMEGETQPKQKQVNFFDAIKNEMD